MSKPRLTIIVELRDEATQKRIIGEELPFRRANLEDEGEAIEVYHEIAETASMLWSASRAKLGENEEAP